MRKLLFLLIPILSVSAQYLPVLTLNVAAIGGTCGTVKTTSNSTGSDAGFETYIYHGFSFTPTSSYTVCSAKVDLRKVGTPPGTLQVLIYTDNGASFPNPGRPSTLVGTGSATVTSTTLGTTYALVTFTGMSAALTSGTIYWIIYKSSVSSGGDTANTANSRYTFDGNGQHSFVISTDGTTWSLVGTSTGSHWELYAAP